MTRRSTATLLLTETERARLCAEGFVTVKVAAAEIGYTGTHVRRLCYTGALYHRRDRTPGASRDSIRIPVVALREFKQRLTPLRDQIVEPQRAAYA